METNPDRFDLPEWEILVGEAAKLGTALGRFENALDAYKKARDKNGTLHNSLS